MLNAMQSVRRGGRLVAEAAGSGGPVPGTAAAVLVARADVEHAFAAALGDDSAGAVRAYTPAHMLQTLAGVLLPACAPLATALVAHWREPEQLAALQLQAAQAAAARSCAFLHCCNLGARGGPAAGEGAGSQRCRWAVGWVAIGAWLHGC